METEDALGERSELIRNYLWSWVIHNSSFYLVPGPDYRPCLQNPNRANHCPKSSGAWLLPDSNTKLRDHQGSSKPHPHPFMPPIPGLVTRHDMSVCPSSNVSGSWAGQGGPMGQGRGLEPGLLGSRPCVVSQFSLLGLSPLALDCSWMEWREGAVRNGSS